MRIVLVEDNPGLRETFAQMVASMPAHQLVAAYPSAEAAKAAMQPGDADLAVVDIELPGESGIELIRWLKESQPDLPAVVWTVHEARDSVYAAIKAGALGYLIKAMALPDLQAALHELERGGAPMSPRIARRVLRDVADSIPEVPPHEALSARELAVLRAIARGDTHKEIAQQLSVSMHTVHSHIGNTYRKLHAMRRADALARARQLGLIPGP